MEFRLFQDFSQQYHSLIQDNDKNKEAFIKSVENLQFMPTDEDTDPDELFEEFHSKLSRAYYESFPLIRECHKTNSGINVGLTPSLIDFSS